MVSRKAVFKYKIILFILFFVFLFSIGTLFSRSQESALAAKQKVMEIVQVGDVQYSGMQFVDETGHFCDTDMEEEGFNNDLFNSFRFTLDKQDITDLSYTDVVINTEDVLIKDPKTYVLSFSVYYDNVLYTVNSVAITISKRVVTVYTYLNGETNLEIDEGEEIVLTYSYVGAVSEHYSGDGNTIDREYLTIPAWTDADMTKPIEYASIVADHAESPFYTFKYEASHLTIREKSVRTLEFSDSNGKQLIVAGDFSILHTVKYTNLGINPSSTEYSVISARADSVYKDTGFFDKYEKINCFSVQVLYNDNYISESLPATFTVFSPNLNKEKKYKIIALYNNGNSEILDAHYSEGYLTFSGADIGDFIVVSEIEGLSLTKYVLVIVSGFAVVVLIVLLFAVFRRKY